MESDACDLDRVVGDEAVAALDQLDGQLALADAAVAQNQDALAVDLYQHAMAGDAGRKLKVQHADEAAHQGAGHLVGAQQRYFVLLRQLQHLRKRLQLLAAADDDGWRLLAEQLVEALAALFGGKPGQKVHFREAHDLQAQLVEVVIVAGQKQTRAVDFSDLDADLVQLARRISDLKADLLDQPLERNSEIPHSFFLLHPLCAPRRRHSVSFLIL